MLSGTKLVEAIERKVQLCGTIKKKRMRDRYEHTVSIPVLSTVDSGHKKANASC
jgi:hypothetical protein